MTNRIKIFIFESAADGTVGGSHSCMFNLIKYMDREKFQFTVGFRQDNIYVRKFAELGVDVVRFAHRPVESRLRILNKAINRYRLKWRFQKDLERLFKEKRFNLVVNNNSIWASLDFVKVCGRLDIPLISYERGYGGYLDAHIRATAKLSASIPISGYLESKLVEHGFKAARIKMIYDGINPKDIQTDRSPAAVKAELGIPANARVIGVIGNIRPWKGQRFFVEAFNQLAALYPDLYGLVVGSPGSEAENDLYYRDIQQLVDPSLRGSRLLLLDYHEKIREILSIMDVFVHTSVKPEPFGMVLLEAIAAKTPVVATNMGGPMEILGGGDCGILIPPNDIAAIVKACSQLLGDAALRRRLVEKSYRRLNRRFHIRNTIQETSGLFVEVAEAGNTCFSPPQHSLN